MLLLYLRPRVFRSARRHFHFFCLLPWLLCLPFAPLRAVGRASEFPPRVVTVSLSLLVTIWPAVQAGAHRSIGPTTCQGTQRLGYWLLCRIAKFPKETSDEYHSGDKPSRWPVPKGDRIPSYRFIVCGFVSDVKIQAHEK